MGRIMEKKSYGCPYCHQDMLDLFYVDDSIEIWYCPNCGLIELLPDTGLVIRRISKATETFKD